ncbi:hypothetical protein [[Mycoplasma] testudinis]|uniref:hypothetical protein n=1 Tax=[Mycoplasma] testudinis TaxID=33924 RepID=UPI0004885E3E|nr:hypothetical protein [[Mycoplasma] testudinis]
MTIQTGLAKVHQDSTQISKKPVALIILAAILLAQWTISFVIVMLVYFGYQATSISLEGVKNYYFIYDLSNNSVTLNPLGIFLILIIVLAILTLPWFIFLSTNQKFYNKHLITYVPPHKSVALKIANTFGMIYWVCFMGLFLFSILYNTPAVILDSNGNPTGFSGPAFAASEYTWIKALATLFLILVFVYLIGVSFLATGLQKTKIEQKLLNRYVMLKDRKTVLNKPVVVASELINHPDDVNFDIEPLKAKQETETVKEAAKKTKQKNNQPKDEDKKKVIVQTSQENLTKSLLPPIDVSKDTFDSKDKDTKKEVLSVKPVKTVEQALKELQAIEEKRSAIPFSSLSDQK